MKKLISILFILIAATALSGCKLGSRSVEDTVVSGVMEENGAMMEEGEEMMEEGGAMMDEGEEMMENDDKMMPARAGTDGKKEEGDSMKKEEKDSLTDAAVYTEYSEEKLAQYKGKQKVALFFHAKWCPSCRAADAEITKGIEGLGDNVVVLKTDYDTYTALKKEYGIISQHTFVFLNADGTVASKKLGGGIADIKAFFAS